MSADATPLPQLLDRKTLAAELGVTRAVVDAIFRALDVVVLPDCRKVLVKREDVARLLSERTFRSGDVRP